MEFGQVHHIEYYVNDLPKCREFMSWFLTELGHEPYQDFGEGFSYKHKSGTYLVFVQVKDEHMNVNNNRQGNGLNHLAFQGAEPEEFLQLVHRIKEKGVEVLIEKDGYICFLSPNGLSIEIYDKI